MPGRVRKHLETVEFWLGRIFSDFEGTRLRPSFLPLFVEFLRSVIHSYQLPASSFQQAGWELKAGG
jgi:hypothetical protein